MLRRVSKQIAIAQKLYTRGGQKYTFSESSLSALSKKFKMGSICIPSKILGSPSEKLCCDRVVFTSNASPTSFGGITSDFLWGLQWHRIRTCGQISDIMFTSHDIVTSIQLLANCNLTVCIFESRHDIKNLTTSSYCAPLKTPKTKLEVIAPKNVEGDTF